MKGQARIELFDEITGEKTFDSGIEKNLVTNLYKSMMEDFYSVPPCVTLFNGVKTILNTISPISLMGGIALWGDTIAEDPNTITCGQVPIGYAGDTYNGNDNFRGTLNVSESGEIKKDGVTKGYTWVWDFPSNSANGVIKSISLTNKDFGNGSPKGFYVSPKGYGSNTQSYSVIPLGDDWRYLYDGKDLYLPNELGYSKIKQGTIKPNLSFIQCLEQTIFKLDGYADLSQPCFLKEFIYFIGKNITDSKIYLLKVNKGMNTIIENTELTNFKDKVVNFGIVKEKDTIKYLIYNSRIEYNNGSRQIVDSYDCIKKTKVDRIVGERYYSYDASYQEPTNIFTVPTTEGTIVISSNFHSYGNSNLHGNYIVILPNYKISVYGDFSNNNDDRLAYSIRLFQNKPYGVSITNQNIVNYTNYYTEVRLAILSNAIFTINNLSAPIEKTNNKTMKITYSLTWE